MSDEEVLTLAIEQNRVIITLDLDFGEIFHFHERGRVGIMY
ncbi:MAG: DUF5615 family PIN-like protein [Theionarchaea archaeon]|nr:DUF5615 family PIN-like protein [Theionarchaea archaeon]